MPPSEQPPEETFCLTCGPGTVLERKGAVLHCPRCGIREPVPDFPLFVVTGASGTGKTTITEPLRRAQPGCDVFDTDIILQVAALGWDTWRNTWLRLAHAIALNGRVTVLCGSLVPSQLETLPARKLVGPIRFCTLDCPDAVLADRLRARPTWRGTSTEDAIARHQRFAAWLRAHIQPCYDTSQLTPAETAERIAAWISQSMDDADAAPPAAQLRRLLDFLGRDPFWPGRRAPLTAGRRPGQWPHGRPGCQILAASCVPGHREDLIGIPEASLPVSLTCVVSCQRLPYVPSRPGEEQPHKADVGVRRGRPVEFLASWEAQCCPRRRHELVRPFGTRWGYRTGVVV